MRRAALAALSVAALGGPCACGGAGRATTAARPAAAFACPAGGRFDARQIIGLRLASARRLAARHGCTIRPLAIDGRRQPVDADLRSDRIDVFVSRGLVYRLVGVY